jgi:hypothetical protein
MMHEYLGQLWSFIKGSMGHENWISKQHVGFFTAEEASYCLF